MSGPQHAFVAIRYGDKSRVFARLVTLVCGGDQSHVELAVKRMPGGWRCWSSSWVDDGVRSKTIALVPEKWRVYRLPLWLVSADEVEQYGKLHDGARYDWLGLGRFVLPWWPRLRGRLFCSQFTAAALGVQDDHLISPRLFEAFVAAVGERVEDL